MRQVTNEEIEQWVGRVQTEIVDPYYKERFPNQGAEISIDPKGKRYKRIVRQSVVGGEHVPGQSVYCFIDTETGNVHKPAGWKAPLPAKKSGVRGNILAADPLQGVNWCGTDYLR